VHAQLIMSRQMLVNTHMNATPVVTEEAYPIPRHRPLRDAFR
jgi:hypothetical protein